MENAKSGMRMGNYKDGKLDDLYEEWDDKGNLMVQESYKNGEKMVPKR